MKIGIIGAGIAGLAAAVRLASQGHEVDVFEANAYAGGKLSEFFLKQNVSNLPLSGGLRGENTEGSSAYRFDAGPSLFTMPMYIEDLFAAANEPIAEHFSYEKLDVVCQYFWDDGTRLTAFSDKEKLAQEIENQLLVPRQRVLKMLESARLKYELAGRIFLEKSLHKAATWFTLPVLKALLFMPTFDIFKTMNATHERLADGNAKFIQMLNRYATYNGSNPFRASGMLSMIPHFEQGIGAFYPKGGMNEITKALFALAQRRGVRFHFNTKVHEIIVENGKVMGLKAENTEGSVLIKNVGQSEIPQSGEKLKIKNADSSALNQNAQRETHNFDAVVSNMDVFFTYKKLLPNQPHPEKTLQQERSTSALIFYWGIRRTFAELDLHNIFFSKNYRDEFDHLAAGEVSDDPTVYINISSKRTPTDAPDGCENWFTMVNVPHNDGSQDWSEIIERTRRNVLEKISRTLGVDIQSLIEVEELLTPLSIEAKTSSFGGALYGTSSNALMSAFLRHPNFSSKIKGLYFVGGSVHPGGGIPLALLSAKITAEMI